MRLSLRTIGTRARRTALAAGAAAAGALLVLAVEGFRARAGDSAPAPPDAPGHIVGGSDGPPLRLAVLGDSTGVAVGASGVDRGYPRIVAGVLAESLQRPVAIRVLSVSGARVADVRRSQLPELAHALPDIVLVVVGGNDVTHATRRSAARRDLRALLAGSTATGARVVVAGIPAMGTARRVAQPLRWLLGWQGRRLDRVWREEADATSAVRVDLAGSTGHAFSSDPTLYSGDGFHPGDRGYALWAEVLAQGVLRAAAQLADDRPARRGSGQGEASHWPPPSQP